MAVIKVYAQSLTNSGQELANKLTALGHTVTFQSVYTGTPTGFDLLVIQQGTTAEFQTWINAGKPVLVVGSASSAVLGNHVTTVANNVFIKHGLATAYTGDRYYQQYYNLHSGHFLTQGLSSPATYLNSGGTSQHVLDLPLINGGALVPILGTGDTTPSPSLDNGYAVSSGAGIVAFEKGLIYKNVSSVLTQLPVRIAWFGGGAPTTGNGNPTGYSSVGSTILDRLVKWVLGLTTAVDPVASFFAYPDGLVINPVDASIAIASGATIASRFWSFNDGAQTSQALAPTFVASTGGTYALTLVVWDTKGNSNSYTQSFTFGAGSSEPPYDLPTARVAGRYMIKLDSTKVWSGVTGAVADTDGKYWINLHKFPKPGGGTECRWKSREVSNGPDLPVRSFRSRIILDGAAGSLSSGASSSYANTRAPGGAYSAVIFGAREVLFQIPLGDPDSTDPDDWLPRFHGYLDDPLAVDSGLMELEARDVASRLQFAYRGRGIWIGTEGEEILLGDAIQRVLDVTTRPGVWKLRVVGDLEWGIASFLMGSVDDVLEFINGMARNRGAVVKWWPDLEGVYATGRFQLTLFVQQTDKASPDATFGPEDWKAGDHGSDTSNIRTERTLDFFPEGATEPLSIYRPATKAQSDEYGFKQVVIGTDQTKHIRTVAEANVMLDYVDGALLLPATVASRVISPSDPTIDVNSLLRFNPDTTLSTEVIDQYVGDWTERDDISESGEIEDSITVNTRNAPTGVVEAWLRGIAGLSVTNNAPINLPPTWRVLKWVTQDPIYGNYTGSAWFVLEPHGLGILGVRAQTKEPGQGWSEFGAPTRGPGDYSDHFQRILGNYEYEQDVPLDSGGLISSIGAEIIWDGLSNWQAIFEINLDADNDPEVVEVIVTGLNARVKGDDDTLSLHVVKVSGPGSAYSASFDTSNPADHTFAVPVPASSEWGLEARARNTLTASALDKVSPPFPFTVTNTGEPSIAILPVAPVDSSGVVSITQVQASSAPSGYRFQLFMSYQTYPYAGGAGTTFGEIEVTNQLSPSPLGAALPTVATTYSLATDLVRDGAGATKTVVMQFRVTITNGSGVKVFDSLDNPSLTASWGI